MRPSLVNNRAKKRLIEVETKQAENSKRQRELAKTYTVDNVRLQESLNKPITADNKGFQLLAKMGYKAGSGLGKQADARIDPIGFSIKNDRGGLGREAAIAGLAAKRQELRLRKAGIQSVDEISTEAYRRRATQKAEERKISYDLKRCQQTCESLDLAAGVTEPELDFFWPPKPIEPGTETDESESVACEAEPEEEKDEQYSGAEQLELLTSYLRTGYTFCYWCGTHYDSIEDLDSNCPGVTRDEH